MRITKGQNQGAIVRMGRNDDLGGRVPSDPRDFMVAQREMRTAAETFCRRHGLRGYQVFACAAAGGSMLDDVDLACHTERKANR